MENDVTRTHRQKVAGAVKEYHEEVFDNPGDEKEIARDVADKHDVTQKDLKEGVEAGA